MKKIYTKEQYPALIRCIEEKIRTNKKDIENRIDIEIKKIIDSGQWTVKTGWFKKRKFTYEEVSEIIADYLSYDARYCHPIYYRLLCDEHQLSILIRKISEKELCEQIILEDNEVLLLGVVSDEI